MSGHKLRLWVDGEDIGYDIVCGYDANDPARPCAIPACDCPELEDGYHFKDEGCNGKTEPGCNAADWLDNGGYESIAVPDRIEAEVAVDLSWGDPGPMFRPAALREPVGEPQPEPCANPECDGGYVPVRLEHTGTVVDFDPCPSCVPPTNESEQR